MIRTLEEKHQDFQCLKSLVQRTQANEIRWLAISNYRYAFIEESMAGFLALFPYRVIRFLLWKETRTIISPGFAGPFLIEEENHQRNLLADIVPAKAENLSENKAEFDFVTRCNPMLEFVSQADKIYVMSFEFFKGFLWDLGSDGSFFAYGESGPFKTCIDPYDMGQIRKRLRSASVTHK